MQGLIELKGVAFRPSDERTVIERIDLTLFPNETVLVIAPESSGWGGAIIRLITGLARPDSGMVRVFGADVAVLDKAALNASRKRLGVVFRDTALISNLKVIENAALPLLYHSDLSYNECLERASALLGSAGFKGDLWQLPGPLPPHVKKEVAVAAALSLDPAAIVADGLAAGLLDDELKRLSTLLHDYRKNGGALLLIAYNGDDISLHKPDRVIKVEDNRLSG